MMLIAGIAELAGWWSLERQMQALSSKLGGVLSEVGRSNSVANVSAPAVVKNLRHAQAELRSAAVQLESFNPPAKVKAQHQALIRAVREYASELNAVIARVKNGGGARATRSIVTLKGVSEPVDVVSIAWS